MLAHCSRTHAELKLDQNGDVTLRNFSKGGNTTLVNDAAVAADAAAPVADGDVFEICGKKFRFEASVLAARASMADITEESNIEDDATLDRGLPAPAKPSGAPLPHGAARTCLRVAAPPRRRRRPRR